MTTEVLRNMLYAGSATLRDLGYVVMDEVHYLADRFRGAVWEEVIIHLPESVTLVSLSATVSNAEEFADWLVTVRGETEVVVSEHRPVPLWQHMLVGKRMFDLFHDADAAQMHEVHPELLRYTREVARRARDLDGAGRGRGRRPRRYAGRSRPDIVERLDREGLLPAILFVFSRAGCDAAVQQCLHAGLRLTDPDERAEIRHIVETRTAAIPERGPDRARLLGVARRPGARPRRPPRRHAARVQGGRRGAVRARPGQGRLRHRDAGAGHQHAGPLRGAGAAGEVQRRGARRPDPGGVHPAHRPGRPARHRRRGPRGRDLVAEVDPRHVAGLASTRTYPLRSSFRPSYNMAVNLVGSVGTAAARELLESSFAQFQADRSVVGLARQVQRNEETMATARARRWPATLGDFDEYFAIRRRDRRAGEGARAAGCGLAPGRGGRLAGAAEGRRRHPGAGRAPGRARRRARPGSPAGSASRGRWCSPRTGGPGRISGGEFAAAVEALARVRVPKHFNHRSPQERRDLAATVRQAAAERGASRRAGRPASGAARTRSCWQLRRRAARATRATAARTARSTPAGPSGGPGCERDTAALRDKVANRTGSLARTFDRVCALLEARGYLADGDGDRRRPDAGPDLDRGRPAGGRVPAPRRVGRAGPGRARGRGLGGGLRGASRSGRAGVGAARAGRRRRSTRR